MILVTGATGATGSHVVRALAARGLAVRAFVRDADRAGALLGDAADLAVGDFADVPSLRAALEGVDGVFLSCADDPRRVGWETAAIDLAAAAGVRRVVKLSSLVAEPGSPVAFWDWHGRVEDHLRASRVASTVLRASFSMGNLLAAADAVAREGVLPAPAGEARVAMVDPRDVGAAAAAVLAGDGHAGATYVLTGPRAVTHDEVAAALSAATGRGVAYVDVPDAEAERQLVLAGVPRLVAAGIVQVYAALRGGVAARVTATVATLTGRPARDVATFVRDHADQFAPAAIGAGR